MCSHFFLLSVQFCLESIQNLLLISGTLFQPHIVISVMGSSSVFQSENVSQSRLYAESLSLIIPSCRSLGIYSASSVHIEMKMSFSKSLTFCVD